MPIQSAWRRGPLHREILRHILLLLLLALRATAGLLLMKLRVLLLLLLRLVLAGGKIETAR